MSLSSQPASVRRFKKLPARYALFVLPLFLTFFMTGIVSFISTARSIGFHDGMPAIWLSAWGLSWIVAFPTMVVVLPIVRRLVSAIVEQKP